MNTLHIEIPLTGRTGIMAVAMDKLDESMNRLGIPFAGVHLKDLTPMQLILLEFLDGFHKMPSEFPENIYRWELEVEAFDIKLFFNLGRSFFYSILAYPVELGPKKKDKIVIKYKKDRFTVFLDPAENYERLTFNHLEKKK